jgi:hypothetical protein
VGNVFYAKERIGNTRYMTPDGFLLCKDVPLARVGELEYLAQEAPAITPVSGKVVMIRPESALFSEDTIASFNAKPLLNGYHQQVTPDNFQDLAVGVVTNVHRGEGDAAGFLVGDLMIYDRDAIQSVEMGRTEISIGFEAECKEIEPGRGEQSRIIGNHVALVDEGRAGPVCSIGDGKPKEETELAEKEEVKTSDSVDVGTLGKIADMLKGFIGSAGAAGGSDPAPAAAPGGGADANPAPADTGALEGRVAKIELALAEILKRLTAGDNVAEPKDPPPAPAGDGEKKPEGDEEPPKPAGDNAGEEVIVDDEMPPAEIVERAEVLSPGIDVPEGDAKNAMPSLKLAALADALKSKGTAAGAIKAALGKHASNVAKAPKALIDAAFRVGSEAAREVNNSSFMTSTLVFGDEGARDKKIERPTTGADLNKIYAEAWAKEIGGAK